MTEPTNPFEGLDLGVSDEDLTSVSSLARLMVEKAAEVEAFEAQLNIMKQELWKLQTGDLPEAMNKVNMTEFTLGDGTKIECKEDFKAGLPNGKEEPEKRAQALNWLKNNQAGALIKREMVVIFDKGKEAESAAVREFIKEQKLPCFEQENVHWQTLTAWAKEQHTKGVALPKELLGLYIGFKAKVKKGKDNG